LSWRAWRLGGPSSASSDASPHDAARLMGRQQRFFARGAGPKKPPGVCRGVHGVLAAHLLRLEMRRLM
ncbi:MAG: hypothetical protein ACM31C_30445, partial [Acidobacteriota bacterium]